MKANDAILKNMQTSMSSLTNSNLELKNMFGQFMKMNTASSLGSGTLPSNTVTNPKEDFKGITTRSGNAYQGPMIPTTSSPSKVVERETEVTKDTVPPTNNESTKGVQPLVVQIKTPIPNSEPIVALVVEPVEALVSALEPNPKPSIPYPSILHDQKLRDKANDQKEKYFQIFQDLDFNISFADALILIPSNGYNKKGTKSKQNRAQNGKRGKVNSQSNPSSNPTPSTNPNPKGRNRRRSKQRIEDFNLEELSPSIVTMADQRTMTQLLQAPTEGYEDAIVVPAINADNFELKHGLLTLVQNKQFFGHDKEDPHAHVCYFNKITSTLKFLNVLNTSIKLMLFPFSLEGAARIWLEKEPPRSIFTWDDLVLIFINQFFPPSKTTNLRNEITNFQQRFDESFSEAWDRFKDLLRACPHQGFSKLHQLDTFYNALNSKDQDSLNSAAGGNFLDKMPREFLAIIERKSKVCYSRNKPVVAKVITNTSTSGITPDVAELKDMVKALLLDKKGQNQSPAPVKAVEESCVTCGGSHSYRNYPTTDGNVYHDNIQEFVSQASIVNYNQRNTSYRPPMMSNQIRPPGPVYQPPVFQPPPYQASSYQAPAPQTQGVSKEDFSAYVKANDAVMRNMQTQGQNMQNQLTNLTDLMTKYVNSNSASTSSSGTLSSSTIANPRNEPEATKDTVNPTNNRNTEDVQPQVVQYESPILTSKSVTSPISEPVIAPVSASKPNPKSSIPYPSRRNDERNREKANNQIEKFYQIFKDMSFEICFADALILMPKFASTLKALIGNKENMAECLALADLGASINLMPFFVWKRLYHPDLTPTCMTLELADRSMSRSVGVAEDVYVKVGSFHFSADFVVVDFDADPRVPLILGRSFLKTGRALIDVFEGELTLRVGKEAITFNLDQTLRYSTNYSDMTAKHIDVIDMACTRL
nr:hypothetical protein [Tanacetum cinerariifolium]